MKVKKKKKFLNEQELILKRVGKGEGVKIGNDSSNKGELKGAGEIRGSFSKT